MEGIAIIGRLALSPLVSGPLVLASAYTPDALQDVLAAAPGELGASLQSLLDSQAALTALRALFALSLLRLANNALSRMASNAWRLGPSPGWDWPNEIAVVTGGSSGIGRSIVEGLVAIGVRVAVLDIQDLPPDMRERPLISFHRCDVTSTASVAEAAASVRRKLGHPSILINNAGVTAPAPILKVPEAFLRKILGVNLMSLWFTTQEFLPRMIQLDKGHVITIASVASFVALTSAADYSATKAGALAFHEALASELKHCYKSPNVLTTVVHPNFVDTPLLRDVNARLDRAGVRLLTPEHISREVVAQIKSRRGGQLIIPSSTSVVSGIRGWPTWVQELLRDGVGRGSVKK
jgi:NAD(P)-dependent dehydrogenase (short-subunit alcohol dehydrogenase family)